MDLLPTCHPYMDIRDVRRRVGAEAARRLAQLNVSYQYLKMKVTWSLYTPAAPAIQAPLSSNVTDELDRRFQVAGLRWRYRYCRWCEPNQRYTQRVWWLNYKKDAVLPAEAD